MRDKLEVHIAAARHAVVTVQLAQCNIRALLKTPKWQSLGEEVLHALELASEVNLNCSRTALQESSEMEGVTSLLH